MPSRVIRGDINDSVSLNGVSIEAELTFIKLILAADDWGRFDARPAKLKSALFPVRETVRPADVGVWVDELVCEGCLARYESGGRPYVYFVEWEKYRGRSRRGSQKYPSPTDVSTSGKIPEQRTTVSEHDNGSGRKNAGVGVGGKVLGVGVGGVRYVEPAKPASVKSHPPWATENAALLIAMLGNTHGARITPRSKATWAGEIVRLVREVSDLRALADPGPQIEAAIRWLFSDQNVGEFALVVRSGSALRRKWPQIVAAAQRQHERSPEAQSARSDLKWRDIAVELAPRST